METLTLDTFSLQMADLVTPFLALLIVIITGIFVKDLAIDLANGVAFRIFGPFKEGDEVILDGKRATVIRIGLTVTVFGYNDDAKGYIWRYVPNDKIGNLKLGKIISKTDKL